MNLTRLADRIHHKMERKVIQTADNVIVVSNEMVNEFSLFNPKKITLITNGFDSDDVSDVNVGPDKHFTLSHIGTLNSDRNPKALWKVLKQICQNDTDFKERLEIRLIGKTDFSVLEEIKNNGLIKNLVKVDYLSHNEAIVRQKSSQLLLLLINNSANAKGILTGKFFEYLASGRPILAIGPTDGDVAKILKETNSGKIIDFEDEAMLKQVILEYYKLYKNGNLKAEPRSIEKYSRKVLTQTLASLLDDTIK